MSLWDRLSFLAPGWLWAAAAILLPILLHLWSRGERRRVRVGSVHRFGRAESRRARRPRITRWFLLLLRCCLLAVLAGALAQPRVWSVPDPQVDAEPLVFRFGDDLKGDLQEEPLGGAWSLLAEADLRETPGVPFEIFSVDHQAKFSGRRPTLRRPFTWTNLPPSTVSSKTDETRSLGVDLRFHETRSEDAHFFQAAVAAAAEKEGIEIDPEGSDLLIHLSPEPFRESDCADARLVVSDGMARSSSASGAPYDFLGLGSVRVRRLFEVEAVASARLAGDGHGNPLLSSARCGDALWLRFHTRFHPAASNFVLDPVFPRWVRGLLTELAPKALPESFPIHPQDVPRQGPPTTAPRPSDDLERLLWGLAFAFFFAERLVSKFGEDA